MDCIELDIAIPAERAIDAAAALMRAAGIGLDKIAELGGQDNDGIIAVLAKSDATEGWVLGRDKDGGIAFDYHASDIHDDGLEMWKVIAPYVRDGSSIAFLGDDREAWKYSFESGSVLHHAGRIEFDAGSPA